MNKRTIIALIVMMILIFVLTLTAYLYVKNKRMFGKNIGLETKINNNAYLIIKDNNRANKVKIYDDYYDVYLCGVDANIVIDGREMTLKRAFKKKLIDPDEIVYGISLHWDSDGGLDDGGTESFFKGKYKVTKYKKMISNRKTSRSAIGFYSDLFIGTKDCKYKIEY